MIKLNKPYVRLIYVSIKVFFFFVNDIQSLHKCEYLFAINATLSFGFLGKNCLFFETYPTKKKKKCFVTS